ncbi:MAG: 30S ribosomal protein S17 [Planctomycetes bacterium]|nr:30S ribosomal protein S17 [Planctomycetota bacterium]
MSDTPAETPPADATAQPAPERRYADTTRGKRTVFEGMVVSTKMQKTLVVELGRLEPHKKYGKYVRRHTRVYAHDEKGEAQLGDTVSVYECRPYSKLKKYRLGAVLKRAGS